MTMDWDIDSRQRRRAPNQDASLAEPLLAKLSALNPLPDGDRQLIAELVNGRSRALAAHIDILVEGAPSFSVHLILEGHAYRYKILPNGTRQIIGFLVPGDFCDLHSFLVDRMDHSIATRTPCRMVELLEADILTMTARPQLARALWWSSLVEGSILREWLVNVGRRPADRRVAHILCELLMRLRVVGLASKNVFQLELSQGELGDTVGLTTVSVNRALQKLRRFGLIASSGREIMIPDVAALMAFADFDPKYLHIRHDPQEAAG